MLTRMVAPVVVKPDIVSKKASVNDGINPDNMNGKQPNNEKEIQPSVTTAKPSRARTSRSNRVNLKAAKPTTNVITAEMIKKT